MAKAPVLYTFTAPTLRSIEYRPNPYMAIQPESNPGPKNYSTRILRGIAVAVFILVCFIAHFCV